MMNLDEGLYNMILSDEEIVDRVVAAFADYYVNYNKDIDEAMESAMEECELIEVKLPESVIVDIQTGIENIIEEYGD